MPSPKRPTDSVSLFYSYSHKDEALRNKLETHLSLLLSQGVISGWHDRRIEAGTEWDGAISQNLEDAGIILLLVSADFLASRYCRDVEVARAMERHEAGTARVIPVILRPVHGWLSAVFGKLQALPRDGKPVTKWKNRDEAFADITRGINEAARGLDEAPIPPSAKVSKDDHTYARDGLESQDLGSPKRGKVKGSKLQVPEWWKGPPAAYKGLKEITDNQSPLLPISFLEIGLERARAVARIVCPVEKGTGHMVGNGFLIRGNIIITNNHVISNIDAAHEALIQFNYQETTKRLPAQVAEYRLAPAEGFVTSPVAGGSDWTAVRVKGNPNAEWGLLELTDNDVDTGDNVSIIQHSSGSYKSISLYQNIVTFVGKDRVQYLTGTLPASSGSPVFDHQWRVVALHHAARWLPVSDELGSNQTRQYFLNEGIHVRAILKGIVMNGL